MSGYVSAYATAHPWEDWAETFAHYLHIRDTLQTAAAFGMLVTGPRLDPELIAAPSLEPEDRFEDILDHWLPLDLRPQRRQPQHGPRRPLPVRPQPRLSSRSWPSSTGSLVVRGSRPLPVP